MINSVLDTFRRLWRALTHRRRVSGIKFVGSRRELPSDLGAALYIVGTGSAQWAVLNCPCGCGERANAKIGGASRNSWALTIKEGKASLSPSLLMSLERCGSHFCIRDNRIIWI